MENIFRNDRTAAAISYFCKRVTFEDAFKNAHGENEKDREIMAYQILNGFEDIQKYLNKMGYSFR